MGEPNQKARLEGELPTEMHLEILYRSSVKTVVVHTSVTKEIRGLIRDLRFITRHTALRRLQQAHLLVIDNNGCVGFPDNDVVGDRYPPLPAPSSLPRLTNERGILGSSHGIVGGVLGVSYFSPRLGLELVFWNPSLRRILRRRLQPIDGETDTYRAFTFGICPTTLDLKILCIVHTQPRDDDNHEPVPGQTVGSIFTLSSNTWRNLEGDIAQVFVRVPEGLVTTVSLPVVTDSFSYWLVRGQEHQRIIVSFNVTTEVFDSIEVPFDNEATSYKIFNRAGELVLIRNIDMMVTAWVLRGRQLVELFNIETEYHVIGFTHNGKPVMSRAYGNGEVVVFEPDMNGRNILGEFEGGDRVKIVSYEESLVLFERDDTKGY